MVLTLSTEWYIYICFPTFLPTPLHFDGKGVKCENAAAYHPLADLVSKLTVQVRTLRNSCRDSAKIRRCFTCAQRLGRRAIYIALSVENSSHVGQIDHTDHLDHLAPNLPLWYVMKDLYTTDPTQEVCPRLCRLHGYHPAT